ncbi:MAG: MmcQ/YjbR family DNA-binding protein [Actinomycetota bacterium]|nr:MmcQ/YjbR family DNA-binding protein [Actinomycetota bacterium]
MSTWATVKKLGKKLPAVEESTWFRTPSLKVGKRSFVRLKEDDVIVVLVDLEEKELLVRSEPETFSTTPHYDGYPAVLVRLSAIEPEELAEVLEDSWRRVAPKRLLQAFDEGAV